MSLAMHSEPSLQSGRRGADVRVQARVAEAESTGLLAPDWREAE